jgi:hypothetical protein
MFSIHSKQFGMCKVKEYWAADPVLMAIEACRLNEHSGVIAKCDAVFVIQSTQDAEWKSQTSLAASLKELFATKPSCLWQEFIGFNGSFQAFHLLQEYIQQNKSVFVVGVHKISDTQKEIASQYLEENLDDLEKIYGLHSKQFWALLTQEFLHSHAKNDFYSFLETNLIGTKPLPYYYFSRPWKQIPQTATEQSPLVQGDIAIEMDGAFSFYVSPQLKQNKKHNTLELKNSWQYGLTIGERLSKYKTYLPSSLCMSDKNCFVDISDWAAVYIGLMATEALNINHTEAITGDAAIFSVFNQKNISIQPTGGMKLRGNNGALTLWQQIYDACVFLENQTKSNKNFWVRSFSPMAHVGVELCLTSPT